MSCYRMPQGSSVARVSQAAASSSQGCPGIFFLCKISCCPWQPHPGGEEMLTVGRSQQHRQHLPSCLLPTVPRQPAGAGPAHRCPGLAALAVLFVFLGCCKAAKRANKNEIKKRRKKL